METPATRVAVVPTAVAMIATRVAMVPTPVAMDATRVAMDATLVGMVATTSALNYVSLFLHIFFNFRRKVKRRCRIEPEIPGDSG